MQKNVSFLCQLQAIHYTKLVREDKTDFIQVRVRKLRHK